MAEIKKVWDREGGRLYLSYPAVQEAKLENLVYRVQLDEIGRFYLTVVNDKFSFDYKLYGLETDLVNRVIKTYESTNHGNLGILLNGLKGTGKTVTSKIIANKLNQPIIVVDANLKGVNTFLNSITQNITIFIDEYEKVFGEASIMLTIMDGAMNSDFRRVFLLTTNELYVDKNLIQRPGRVRYLKKFEDLKPEVIEEIVDDVLEYPEFKDECVTFISNLEVITVDIVKSIISEVNIHNEAPSAFEGVFNVKRLKGRYNLIVNGEDGKTIKLAESASIYPKPNYSDGNIGYRFEINGQTIGTISRVINWTTLEVSPLTDNNGKNLGFDEPLLIRVEDADIVNYSYKYDNAYGADYASKGPIISKMVENILDAIDADEEEDEGVDMPSSPLPFEDASDS
jgi:broad-specificity NMP kinase